MLKLKLVINMNSVEISLFFLSPVGFWMFFFFLFFFFFFFFFWWGGGGGGAFSKGLCYNFYFLNRGVSRPDLKKKCKVSVSDYK